MASRFQPLITGLLLLTLTACGASGTALVRPASAPTSQATLAAATAEPTSAPPVPVETSAFTQVNASGEVAALRQAGITFMAQGQVAKVLVAEGQAVRKGELLAVLDTRPFDAALRQAEAGLASARAQQSALDEAPRAADMQAAQAQVRQAQIGVAQARTGQVQDVRASEAGVVAVEASLQQTRDQLSLGKTSAEKQLAQAALALTQAQARYAQAKHNWEYAQETGNDPLQPRVTDTSTGKSYDNRLSDGAQQAYYAQYVQAEAAMHQAETSVAQAQAAYDSARQTEVNGIRAAEQQVTQAQATLDTLRVPAGEDRVAAAQANLALAQANLARLKNDPNASQRAQAGAGVTAAEASLAQAKLNREYAELRAPFDAIVSRVGIEPGEAVAPGGPPAVELLDTSVLRFEALVADADIARLNQGQAALVALDALPGQEFAGTVSSIAAAATTTGNSRSYLVRITLDAPPQVRVGMSGTAGFGE